MRFHTVLGALLCCFAFDSVTWAGALPDHVERLIKKQLPADATGVKTINSPSGFSIRYKEPGKDGVCETTPGVNSYSGYVDLDADTHMFFWFFEARTNPNEAPLTLWLNGGPGSDSLTGLFEALGPCTVASNGTSVLNSMAWNEVSNLLFFSQPLGTGFSYAEEVVGVLDPNTDLAVNSSSPDGRYGYADPYKTDTTALAANVTWEVLQAFIQELPFLDETVKSRSFNLWTESYGGHWGPTFFNFFYQQNLAIQNGSAQGVELDLHTLGIINGIISEKIQAPHYPEFAYKNTYGIEAVNETIYNFMKIAWSIPRGCSDYLDWCAASDLSTLYGFANCAEATSVCRAMVEGPYIVSGLSPYDIRANRTTELQPSYWMDYLNTPFVRNALGVNLNYSNYGAAAVIGFDYTGDHVYPSILEDLEDLLDNGVNVALVYGDADYICNWFGGEAVSKQVKYTHSAEFNAAGYAPFIVDGVEYGASRQYGNFSFTRVYDAGHVVPFYQPKAALELFRRMLADLAVSDGSVKVTPTYQSNGTAQATHTEEYSTFTGHAEPTLK